MLSAIFMLPLALELPEVMRLWLKNPPEFAVGLCYCAMLFHITEASTVAHCIIVNAVGKIAKYQIVINAVSVLTLPLAIAFGFLWRDIYVVLSAQIGIAACVSIIRLFFARLYGRTSIRAWINTVFVPLAASIILCAAVGYLPHLFMAASFLRVCVTTACCEIVFLPLSWFVIMTSEERAFMVEKFGPRLKRLAGRA